MNSNDEKPDYTGPTTTIEIPAGLIREGETGQEAGTRLFRTMMEQREEWLRTHPEDEGAIRRIMTGPGVVDYHEAYEQEKKRAEHFKAIAMVLLARLGGDVTISALSMVIRAWTFREIPGDIPLTVRYALCDKDGNLISTKDDDNGETAF